MSHSEPHSLGSAKRRHRAWTRFFNAALSSAPGMVLGHAVVKAVVESGTTIPATDGKVVGVVTGAACGR